MDRIKGYGHGRPGRIKGCGYGVSGGIKGCGYGVPGGIKGYGHGSPDSIKCYGYETADVNILREEKYLRVTPSTPQTLVWMVPGNEIVYGVESNTTWDIE